MSESFKELLKRYQAGELSGDGLQQFFQQLEDEKNRAILAEAIDETAADPAFAMNAELARTEQSLISLHSAIRNLPETPVRSLKRKWISYAAAVIVLLGIGAYLWTQFASSSKEAARNVIADRDPGRKGAVLVFSDGAELLLDTLREGMLVDQKGTKAVLKNGSLHYEENSENAGMVYNTMITPRGRMFQLALPDGTQAWLNSASSIRFPTAFNEDTRQVYITGEVYFEVAKDEKKPFLVSVNQQAAIRVLGTHFNVKAYEDETVIETTLVEGSIQLSAAGKELLLKPGQQARLNAQRRMELTPVVDLNQVLAWKNGLFNFNGYDLKAVMREISRWYDLDIVYEKEPAPTEIVGEMQRDLKLSVVMDILKDLDIRYRLDGKKLIITE